MKIPMVALAAFLAIIPLNSSAQIVGCTLNGVLVPGDPELIEGTSSADVIDCSTSPYRHDIYGYQGNDFIIGSDYDDFIAGGSGNDTIHGRGGDDAIDGGANDDTIYGDGGNDIIFGGVGSSSASGVNCQLQAEAAGSSYLTKGGSGDDTIYGDGPNFPGDPDFIDNGAYDARIEHEGDGNDCINAGSGEDVVYGQGGNDTLLGGNHADYLYGGSGHDYINGGWHYDKCTEEGVADDVTCEEKTLPDPYALGSADSQ